MKGFQLSVVAAALALVSLATRATHCHNKAAAEHAPTVSPHSLAPQADGYYVPYVTDAAGKPVPVIQMPSSITVIPQQLMQDQQDITVCDALRNVSGVFCR
jgi:outer membrane receptor for monomeric catechols